MGYYMRFFSSGPRAIDLSELRDALRARDPRFDIDTGGVQNAHGGELRYGDSPHALLELNRPGDGLFDDEIAEFLERIEEGGFSGSESGKVAGALRRCREILSIQVLFQDRKAEATLRRLDPLWDWLASRFQGISQADGEGFYSEDHAVLLREVE